MTSLHGCRAERHKRNRRKVRRQPLRGARPHTPTTLGSKHAGVQPTEIAEENARQDEANESKCAWSAPGVRQAPEILTQITAIPPAVGAEWPDPVYWAIENHRTAFDAWETADQAFTDEQRDETVESQLTVAMRALLAAEDVLLATVPKTQQGMHALAAYLVVAADRWGAGLGDSGIDFLKCLARACTREAAPEITIQVAMGAET